MKYSLTLHFPVEFVTIKNGERVIRDVGPAEIEVEVVDGEVQGESPLQKIENLLHTAAQNTREPKR